MSITHLKKNWIWNPIIQVNYHVYKSISKFKNIESIDRISIMLYRWFIIPKSNRHQKLLCNMVTVRDYILNKFFRTFKQFSISWKDCFKQLAWSRLYLKIVSSRKRYFKPSLANVPHLFDSLIFWMPSAALIDSSNFSLNWWNWAVLVSKLDDFFFDFFGVQNLDHLIS